MDNTTAHLEKNLISLTPTLTDTKIDKSNKKHALNQSYKQMNSCTFCLEEMHTLYRFVHIAMLYKLMQLKSTCFPTQFEDSKMYIRYSNV